MKKIVLLIGALTAIVIVIWESAGDPRRVMKQCCARMMERIPEG